MTEPVLQNRIYIEIQLKCSTTEIFSGNLVSTEVSFSPHPPKLIGTTLERAITQNLFVELWPKGLGGSRNLSNKMLILYGLSSRSTMCTKIKGIWSRLKKNKRKRKYRKMSKIQWAMVSLPLHNSSHKKAKFSNPSLSFPPKTKTDLSSTHLNTENGVLI